WASRTYSEFLTSLYVRNKDLPSKQVLGLITHNGKVIPQLAEAAMWLAKSNDDLFSFILEHDPTALILGDGRIAEDSKKELIVERLLSALKNGTIRKVDSSNRRLRSLKHPSLAKQLQHALQDE